MEPTSVEASVEESERPIELGLESSIKLSLEWPTESGPAT